MQGTGIVMGGKECYAMDSSFFSWAHHAAWLWLHNMKWNRIRCFAYWPKGCDAAVGWWSRTECIGLRTPLKCHEKSPVGLKSWMWGFKVQQRFELEVDGEMNSSSYLAWYLHLVGTISTTTSTTIPEMYCTTSEKTSPHHWIFLLWDCSAKKLDKKKRRISKDDMQNMKCSGKTFSISSVSFVWNGPPNYLLKSWLSGNKSCNFIYKMLLMLNFLNHLIQKFTIWSVV